MNAKSKKEKETELERVREETRQTIANLKEQLEAQIVLAKEAEKKAKDIEEDKLKAVFAIVEKLQVKEAECAIYKVDFESERDDRQRMHHELTDLKAKLQFKSDELATIRQQLNDVTKSRESLLLSYEQERTMNDNMKRELNELHTMNTRLKDANKILQEKLTKGSTGIIVQHIQNHSQRRHSQPNHPTCISPTRQPPATNAPPYYIQGQQEFERHEQYPPHGSQRYPSPTNARRDQPPVPQFDNISANNVPRQFYVQQLQTEQSTNNQGNEVVNSQREHSDVPRHQQRGGQQPYHPRGNQRNPSPTNARRTQPPYPQYDNNSANIKARSNVQTPYMQPPVQSTGDGITNEATVPNISQRQNIYVREYSDRAEETSPTMTQAEMARLFGGQPHQQCNDEEKWRRQQNTREREEEEVRRMIQEEADKALREVEEMRQQWSPDSQRKGKAQRLPKPHTKVLDNNMDDSKKAVQEKGSREELNDTPITENPLIDGIDQLIQENAQWVCDQSKRPTTAEVVVDDDSSLPYDPNLVCPKCGKRYRIGGICMFRRHVKELCPLLVHKSDDQSTAAQHSPAIKKSSVAENPLIDGIDQEIQENAQWVRDQSKRPTIAEVEEDNDSSLPYDPNLVCPKCGKRYHIGGIQKFRLHVKELCPLLENNVQSTAARHSLAIKKSSVAENPLMNIDQEIQENAQWVRDQSKRPTTAEVEADEFSSLPYDPNLVCPKCGKRFHIGGIQKFRRHVKELCVIDGIG